MAGLFGNRKAFQYAGFPFKSCVTEASFWPRGVGARGRIALRRAPVRPRAPFCRHVRKPEMMVRSKLGSPFNNRRHLTILVSTAELGSMKEAAKAFGVELFVRSNHGCIPTAKGSAVISLARRLLAEIDKAERNIRELKEM